MLTVHDTPGAFTESGVGGRVWTIASTLTAPFVSVSHDASASLNVAGSSAFDTFNVGSQGSGQSVSIDGGDGPDTVVVTMRNPYDRYGSVHIGGAVAADTLDVAVTGTTSDSSYGSSVYIRQLADRGVLSGGYDGTIASWGTGIKQVRYSSTGDISDNVTVTGPLSSSTKVDLSLGAGADEVVLSGPATLNGGRIDAGDTAIETFDTCAADAPDGRCGDILAFLATLDGVDLDLQSAPFIGFELVRGTVGDDTLNGTAADEWFVPGAGVDSVDGRGGNDTFSAADGTKPSADRYIGGDGVDHVTYVTRSAPLTISIDGIANDGARDEMDDVTATIENVTGGVGRDTLTGSATANVLDGATGSDTFMALRGKDGGDTFIGGADSYRRKTVDIVSYAQRRMPVIVTLDDKRNDGAPRERDRMRDIDQVIGGRGSDTLTGSGLVDVLLGGPGNDRLTGGRGTDVLRGGAGNDRFLARDRARDVVDGGSGIDFAVTFDRTDRLVRVP